MWPPSTTLAFSSGRSPSSETTNEFTVRRLQSAVGDVERRCRGPGLHQGEVSAVLRIAVSPVVLPLDPVGKRGIEITNRVRADTFTRPCGRPAVVPARKSMPTYGGYSPLTVMPCLVNGFTPRVGRRW